MASNFGNGKKVHCIENSLSPPRALIQQRLSSISKNKNVTDLSAVPVSGKQAREVPGVFNRQCSEVSTLEMKELLKEPKK
jgi:hypothetical protein